MWNLEKTAGGRWERLETGPARKPGILSSAESRLYRTFRKLDKRLVRQDWHLATVPFPSGARVELAEMHVLANPRGAFLADPIPLMGRPNDFLVEDMDWQLGRAYISHIRIDDEGRFWICRKVILGREHLSFPMNFIYDDRLFVTPESTKSGATRMWTYSADTLISQDVGCLIDVPFYDPVIFEQNDSWFLLGMTQSPGRELALYKSESPLGNWERISLINTTGLVRPGGATYDDGDLIIPMQGESSGYGSELFFCHLTLVPFPKLEVRNRIDPPAPYLGLHSYAQGRDHALVDLQYDVFHSEALKRRFLRHRRPPLEGSKSGTR